MAKKLQYRRINACACGTQGGVAVTLFASTLGIVPRHKSKSRKIVFCSTCLHKPTNRTRAALIEAAQVVGREAIPAEARK